MTSYGETLTESLSMTDTYSRVWVATPEYTDPLNLTDTPTYVWVLARTYTDTLSLTDTELSNPNKISSETITLTDGDTLDQDIVQVSPNGDWHSIIASNSSLVTTMDELIKLLEKRGAPRSQTQIALTHDGSSYAAVAVIKKH
jgi:hypothetical protein